MPRSLQQLVTSELRIPAPRGFSFWRTAYSHGWCDLPPFRYDIATQKLGRVLHLGTDTVVDCTISARGHTVAVAVKGAHPISSEQRSEISRQLRTCLRLDEDFTAFHREAMKHPRYRWIARSGSGRLLRAPTVFEDVVKTICTTNCTWVLTTLMVKNLVEHLGTPFDRNSHAFPTPEAIASSSEQYLRSTIKTGYRSPYLLDLAEKIAGAQLDLESWRTSDASTDDLFRRACEIKGVGPYAAGTILRLLGRYDYLGLDSWVRKKFYELHKNGRKVKDSTIEKHYHPYGGWRGLFFWMEMTRDWHDEKFRTA